MSRNSSRSSQMTRSYIFVAKATPRKRLGRIWDHELPTSVGYGFPECLLYVPSSVTGDFYGTLPQ